MKNKIIGLIIVGIVLIITCSFAIRSASNSVQAVSTKISRSEKNKENPNRVESAGEYKEKSVLQDVFSNVRYFSLTDTYDYEDDSTLKNGMCMELEDSVSENQFLSYFFKESPENVMVEDNKSKVYRGKENDKDVFVAIINGEENQEYPKFAYGFKYSTSDSVIEAKYDVSKKGEEIFDAIYSLDGTKYPKADFIKPLSDNQEKTYFKNDKNENVKVDYRADPYGEGCYSDSGEVFFDKKGRPWYRDYYMTNGRGFSYYLYNEDDELTQYINFGGMAYKGLEENQDIAIGVDFETYIFK